MEERGKKAIAGEAVGGPAEHRGAKAIPKASGVGTIFRVCTSDLTEARGYQRRSQHVRLHLLVRRKQHLVFGGQWLRLFSRIDDDVPFAGFERIDRTDVYAKDGVIAPSTGLSGGFVVCGVCVWLGRIGEP